MPVAAVLDELLGHDDHEHPDVSLTHETEWCLSAYPGGLDVLENVEVVEPRHLDGAGRPQLEDLWGDLAAGDLHDWRRRIGSPGYG